MSYNYKKWWYLDITVLNIKFYIIISNSLAVITFQELFKNVFEYRLYGHKILTLIIFSKPFLSL